MLCNKYFLEVSNIMLVKLNENKYLNFVVLRAGGLIYNKKKRNFTMSCPSGATDRKLLLRKNAPFFVLTNCYKKNLPKGKPTLKNINYGKLKTCAA